jgi:hypothetical protein
MKKYQFDTVKYNFKELVCSYLDVDRLENLNHPSINIIDEETAQSTFYHKKFYSAAKSDNALSDLYGKFVKDFIQNLFEEPILYQSFPAIRIHYKNSFAAFNYHKDKEYRIAAEDKNLVKHEINFFLPLTNAYDTNTFWLETKEDVGDYYPVEGSYGDLITFDGANLRHGNKPNLTGQVRVSFDFRILPERIYQKHYGTINHTNSTFVIGEKYKK